ncbi:hypothetical protein H6F90_20285 [Trichocoleus sp. FACHB-591]|uniref:hypothetical protein n=1 Tax=Trichocoleus sp. FACHB-591 TaxID=2692872 RepID=UPI001689542E|nr:hypothetical protein [Trichocoleus sp. FACHB-591]MBD2097441.1 hypothetical protein [Trichocoleus sp. FACHB-591]
MSITRSCYSVALFCLEGKEIKLCQRICAIVTAYRSGAEGDRYTLFPSLPTPF